MNYIFAPINQGFIIAILMGFLVLLVSLISIAAPELLVEQKGKKLRILHLPLIGFLLSLIGVGEVPILFLLGIYPVIMGIVGWTGNLFCLLLFNLDPLSHTAWWTIRLTGLMIALIFVKITGNLRKSFLKTYTVQLIPERLIGTEGKIVAILDNSILQVSLYDEIGKFSLHVFCTPWEGATDTDFQVGNKVYIVDSLSARHYSVVKFDSEDQLKVMSLKLPPYS